MERLHRAGALLGIKDVGPRFDSRALDVAESIPLLKEPDQPRDPARELGSNSGVAADDPSTTVSSSTKSSGGRPQCGQTRADNH